ncbi:potential zinc finger protein [Pseudozyma hubeiensis SY62]|uniref:Potential zinc finger protein n=1 Tax=Pseudozyma hubeiensis (strain SY62) TaxID=1305764 RepID=R9PAX0_PSEHS|nr:potential zinc finger protein [Pseudozyma hubeiensis SY62]GAC98362.1 potential zinc finger protein [Pseudozyma hubeiensis SY62]
MHPSTSTSTLTHIDPAASSSSSSTMSYPSSFALAAPTPATNLSSAPSSSDVASISQPSLITSSGSSSNPSSMYSSAIIPSSKAFDSALAAYPASSALVDLSASCPPEGPSFSTTGFDPDLAAASLAPIFGTADSTLIDTSATPFSFPALPASLLDEAPEYEYSVHTRLNVFEASEYGEVPSFSFADDGTPLLDAATEYGLWSTGLGGLDDGNLANSSAFPYPHDDLAVLDSNRLDTQPRTAAHLDLSSRPENSFGPSQEVVLAPRNTTTLPPPGAVGEGLVSGANNLSGPSAAGLVDSAPSVLAAGPAASQMYQRPHQHAMAKRSSLEGDDLYKSQAGPSRGLHRSRDAHSAANSPYGRGRPALHPQRSLHNLPAAAGFSPPELNPDLRRLSTGGGGVGNSGVGAVRGPSRDPMVPSQNVGRARLMSWQSGRAYSGEQEWQQQANFTDPSMGAAADAGPAAGPHGMPDALGMQSGGMMPPSRSFSYSMHQSSSGFKPHHGMNPHQSDMINALGDAMDARIDVDGIAKCPYPNCNKTFAKNRSYNLKAHLRSHSQLKPFACSVCPRAFSRKHDLERHSRVHSGDKPYVCEICGKGFPRSDALRRHWRVEKECGDKAAELEASQSLTSVLGEGYEERSPDQQNHHPLYGAPQQQGAAGSMGGFAHHQYQQQQRPQLQQQYSSQSLQGQQQRGWADQQQQQQQMRRA